MQMTKEDQVEKIQGHTYWQWILAVLANMTLFIYGLDVGWMSPMVKLLQSDQSPAGEPLSDIIVSWIASIFCLVAIFTVSMYSFIAERFGSKASVIIILIPQTISWVIRICFATGSWLIISRIFSGIAAGGCFNAVILYVKEISQDSIRGILGSMIILFQNVGVLVMYIMGAYLDYYTIIWIVACIPVVVGILLLKAPDSPAFLVKKGKIEEAIATVAFLRGLEKDHKTVINEVTLMKNENDFYKSQPNLSLMAIVKNPIWRRGLIVSTVIIMIQAMNGTFAITTYASLILTATGVKFNVSPETLTLIIPVVLIFGFVVYLICAARMRRRTQFIIMLSITVCSKLTIAISMLMKLHDMTVPSWLPILCMMVSSVTNCSIAVIPYIVLAEMFSFQTRAKVLGVAVTLAWLVSFLPIIGFIPLSNVAGIHTTFFIFAGINAFGLLVTVFFLPETKGKSVEEIEKDIAIRIGLDKAEKTIT